MHKNTFIIKTVPMPKDVQENFLRVVERLISEAFKEAQDKRIGECRVKDEKEIEGNM